MTQLDWQKLKIRSEWTDHMIWNKEEFKNLNIFKYIQAIIKATHREFVPSNVHLLGLEKWVKKVNTEPVFDGHNL